MSFTPRTTAPSLDDPNWIKVPYGKNHALEISKTTHSVLPNCTGYVHGRALEACGPEVEEKLCLYNADQYFNYTKDGFVRSQVPRENSIMCWSKTGKAGHVAFCEKVMSDGKTVLCSNSNYSGTCFYTKTCDPTTWPVGYKFQGYIYLPNKEDRVGTPVQRDESKNQIEVTYAALRARKRPELSSEVVVGFINMGIYDILQERDLRYEASNGYLWLEVEPDVWIAHIEGCTNLLEVSEENKSDPELKDELNRLKWDLESAYLTIEKLNAKIDAIKP